MNSLMLFKSPKDSLMQVQRTNWSTSVTSVGGLTIYSPFGENERYYLVTYCFQAIDKTMFARGISKMMGVLEDASHSLSHSQPGTFEEQIQRLSEKALRQCKDTLDFVENMLWTFLFVP